MCRLILLNGPSKNHHTYGLSKVTWNPQGQGSTNCATLPSWLGEHWEYGEHEKYGKHQPGDLRHSMSDSIHDSKHYL